MGATVFAGLLVLVLVSQGQDDTVYAMPHETMGGTAFTDDRVKVPFPLAMAWTLHFSLDDPKLVRNRNSDLAAVIPSAQVVTVDVVSADVPAAFEQTTDVPRPGLEPLDVVVTGPDGPVIRPVLAALSPPQTPESAATLDLADKVVVAVLEQVPPLQTPVVEALSVAPHTQRPSSRSDAPADRIAAPGFEQALPNDAYTVPGTVETNSDALALLPPSAGSLQLPDVATDPAPNVANSNAQLRPPVLDGAVLFEPTAINTPNIETAVGPQVAPRVSRLDVPNFDPPHALAKTAPDALDTAAPTGVLPAVHGTPRETFVTGDRVHLRETPEIESPSLAQYDFGTIGLLREERGLWRRVTIDGQTGWMFADYLSPDRLEGP